VALLGWLDAHEPFNGRKFSASVIRSLFAGIVWAVAYDMGDKPLNWGTIMGAIASGPFFDTVVNRIAGKLGNAQFPLSAEKKGDPPAPSGPPAGTPTATATP
jgi:hypothetical protein